MVTKEQMIELDKRAIEHYNIPGIVLMENAGMGIFYRINTFNSYCIICGVGNNGGDGLVIGRHLLLNRKDVEIFIIGNPKKGTEEFKLNLKILKSLGVKPKIITDENIDELIESLEVNEITVDCIFGTGLSRELEGIYKEVVEKINTHSNYTISVDIPSGLDASNGRALGEVVRASKTYTIHDEKVGFLYSTAPGEIEVVYIGIPEENETIKKN